ncbi:MULTISPECIES: TetR/AcrR family transcriptional regulator [Frankia]|uniref:TetR family transcriptional regulatory protein n=1 Tax=Frankia alni (strain DSM 45986 / CECT 9034 / ACN14a) TaxID=326424 RepID=Q0RQQ0_FRAAA|nr:MULTISPECIES: TetR/AcrR family transcriptional regulator [Frankia]CAJ60123.1 putative tetR family transcriptional regulatory protein [Frankia alni ACN14a]
MPSDRTSAGDPVRTLALLWRDPSATPRRGPARGLSVDAVVDAAVTLADGEGLAAVTMRRVAQALEVVPMTLYTYVPGKAELLDLMLDATYARMERADSTGEPWRKRLAAIARENRALFEAHPWAAAVSTLRPSLGPGSIAKYEHELAALDGLGLSDTEMDDCLTHLLSFVQANARAAIDANETRAADGLSDQQWWDRAGPLLARVLDPDAFPLAVRVGSAAGAARGSAHDPGHAFRFGLARVLDGLAALIEPARAVDTGERPPGPDPTPDSAPSPAP